MILWASWASAATIHVGPTRQYRTVQDGVNAAADGDIIEIDSGEYAAYEGWAFVNKNNLTIRGVGPTRPMLNGHYAALALKGLLITQGANITIENLEIYNCRVNVYDGANGSGIRAEGAGLTVRNCYFHDNDNGIMGAYNTTSDVLVEYCEFNHNGHIDLLTGQPDNYSGYSHNMYIGTSRTFTLRYCYSHDTAAGHEVKTRAYTNCILYNLLSSETGTGSRELQIAQGGTAYIIGNVVVQGPSTGNSEIVTYGGEGTNANPYLYVINNTFINKRGGSSTFLMMRNSPSAALFQNNIVQRMSSETVIGGSYAGSVTQIGNWITANAWLRDPANRNYRLTTSSTGAIDMGTAPGIGYNNYALTPTDQYFFPCSTMIRPVNGAIDIGAYEYTANQPPTVNAGPGAAVYENQVVHLNATAIDTDADPLSYSWGQQAGLTVVLSGANGPNPGFTAPAVYTTDDASLTFNVTVSDGNGHSAMDSVNVRVWLLGDCSHDDAVDVIDLLTLAENWACTLY